MLTLPQLCERIAMMEMRHGDHLGRSFLEIVGAITCIVIAIILIGCLPLIPDFLRYLKIRSM